MELNITYDVTTFKVKCPVSVFTFRIKKLLIWSNRKNTFHCIVYCMYMFPRANFISICLNPTVCIILLQKFIILVLNLQRIIIYMLHISEHIIIRNPFSLKKRMTEFHRTIIVPSLSFETLYFILRRFSYRNIIPTY